MVIRSANGTVADGAAGAAASGRRGAWPFAGSAVVGAVAGAVATNLPVALASCG